ncbi:MAG: C40 family peptidase [Mycobacterium sp.]
MTEVELLARAHALFGAAAGPPGLDAGRSPGPKAAEQGGTMAAHYRRAARSRLAELDESRRVDAALSAILHAARADHAAAHRDTGAVLAAARADAAAVAGSPIAARELLARRMIRLRRQRAHVQAARAAASRRRSGLRSLRYRIDGGGGSGVDRRAETAVRAALSRLGRPYVWGATGPDRFDCSGLVQWAYAQAGVRLHRTTYQQIHDGIPVARSAIRPGDLVFPHTGHVQMSIGGNLVVEAPQPGATVQISRLGANVAVRRPV